MFLSIEMNSQALFEKEDYAFSRQDSLRGSNTKERAWWDVKNYNLNVKINPLDSSITGFNSITYKVLKEYNIMQIDLQNPLTIDKIIQGKQVLEYKRDGNVYYVYLRSSQKLGTTKEICVYYSGKPKTAINPPWDGGITWKQDNNGKAFAATASQGIGASVWWPNKDQLFDEVESMQINLDVPDHLVGVSNGRLLKIKNKNNGNKTFRWAVKNPINNYDVCFNIGDYVSFTEKFNGENGSLNCSYYVLKDNLIQAKEQFKEVSKMLKAFEHWFGPYPFYEDSYKLVETPFLGMEHQSAIAYGNKFQNGYLGSDLSGTGWGLQFDFIIVHESGHEWFGNSISCKDSADMWIHESFTTYSESLFLEYYYGKDAGDVYNRGIRKNILNDKPIIGTYGVNKEGSSDMYYKGANMLHTLRQIVNNDVKWRTILRGLNTNFYHQTVTTEQIEDYLNLQVGLDLTSFFNQYLRDSRIPTLEYCFKENQFGYRWVNCVPNFNMPVRVTLNGTTKFINPDTNWSYEAMQSQKNIFKIDDNFYVLELESTE